ncbi:MAG: hypothetical protein ABI867_14695 [Kofleriaceae bacterium]
MRFVLLMLALVACGACGDDGAAVDASITVDIDNGTCGAELRFTGEYIDWDQDGGFCGIFDAAFASGADTLSTAPNGRFDTCIDRAAAQVVYQVTPSATASQCTDPQSTYPLPTIAVASNAVINAGGFWSGRNFTVARQASLGVTLDPAKAHVFVHVDGTPRAVAVAAAHDAPQANAATTWAAGDTGHEVFFPNVDVGGGTTMVSVTGGAIGTGSIPVAAGKITSVSLIAN